MLLREHQLIRDDLWVQDGKIIDPENVFFDNRAAADVQIDCKNAIIAPGFIEVQINGKIIFASSVYRKYNREGNHNCSAQVLSIDDGFQRVVKVCVRYFSVHGDSAPEDMNLLQTCHLPFKY